MKQADPPEEVFRLGRRPDPWAWPDWAYADADGTFGNRYDDPQGIYRVLYASTQRVATFVECLAYYRPDIEVVAELQAIVGEEGDEEAPAAGIVPAGWVGQRCVGRATLVGDYADVGHHESLAELRAALAARVVHHGLHDLDAATLRLIAPRAFTQDVSRYLFRQTAAARGVGTDSRTSRSTATTCRTGRSSNQLIRKSSTSRSSTAMTPTSPPRSPSTACSSSSARRGRRHQVR